MKYYVKLIKTTFLIYKQSGNGVLHVLLKFEERQFRQFLKRFQILELVYLDFRCEFTFVLTSRMPEKDDFLKEEKDNIWINLNL